MAIRPLGHVLGFPTMGRIVEAVTEEDF